MLLCRELGAPDNAPDSHSKLRSLVPPLRERIKVKTKEMLIDEELHRRRYVGLLFGTVGIISLLGLV